MPVPAAILRPPAQTADPDKLPGPRLPIHERGHQPARRQAPEPLQARPPEGRHLLRKSKQDSNEKPAGHGEQGVPSDEEGVDGEGWR